MARAFYPFVDNGDPQSQQGQEGDSTPPRSPNTVSYPARIAVYDDAAAAPRVVIVDPTDVRSYLEEITAQVTALSHEQGGTIPFTVIREIVENLIHAYFIEPTISILDGGNTIRFSDQGPGIKEKERALEYGTSTATEEMKRYIRGVGSGLPYVQQYMEQKGGCLLIEDNLSQGTVVTISTKPLKDKQSHGSEPTATQSGGAMASATSSQVPAQPAAAANVPPIYAYDQYGRPIYAQQAYQQPYPPYQSLPQNGYAGYAPYPQQATWPAGQQTSNSGQTYAVQQGGQAAASGAYQQINPQVAPADAQLQSASAPQNNAPLQGAAPAPAMPTPNSPANEDPFSWITITERGRMALEYLNAHEFVGPSDLQRAYGGSQPTWTRELKTLEDDGLIKKEGQKRHLTNLGRAFVEREL